MPANITELMANVVPFAILGSVFYFFLLRPQQQKAKKHNEMMSSLKKGDKIVTTGGFVGTISAIPSDKEFIIEISNGVDVIIEKCAIAGLSQSSASIQTSSDTKLSTVAKTAKPPFMKKKSSKK